MAGDLKEGAGDQSTVVARFAHEDDVLQIEFLKQRLARFHLCGPNGKAMGTDQIRPVGQLAATSDIPAASLGMPPMRCRSYA